MEARIRDSQFVGELMRKTLQSIISPFRAARKTSLSTGLSSPSSISIVTYPSIHEKVAKSSNQSVNSAENTLRGPLHQPDASLPTDRPQIEEVGQVDGRAHAQYTNGSTRIITAPDGEKDCLALLLTADLVAQLNELIQGNRRLASTEGQFRTATFAATNAELSINQAKHLVEVAYNEAAIDHLRQDMAKLKPVFQEASNRRDQLESDANIFRIDFRASQNQSLRLFERLLSEANQLVSTEAAGSEVNRSKQETTAELGLEIP